LYNIKRGDLIRNDDTGRAIGKHAGKNKFIQNFSLKISREKTTWDIEALMGG
jgi:hypothetical protein